MKYKDILHKRKETREKVEDLKSHRDLKENEYKINKDIEREKFKYKIYNQLLKVGNKNE